MELPINKMSFGFQETADPRSLSLMEKIMTGLNAILQSVRSTRIEFPKVYPVTGTVNVNTVVDLPPIEVRNLADLRPYFETLSKNIGNLQLETMGLRDVLKTFPKDSKDFKFPTSLDIKGFNDLLDAMEELKKGFNILINKEGDSYDKGHPMPVSVINFPPQMVPTPVTNVTLNGLQGYVKTTATTVGTSVTPLPDYGNLFDRRAMQIYNNDSTAPLFIGGSDVSTTNGLPVPPKSYSPALDAGYNMVVYGVSAASINVRVIEISKSQAGVEYN